MSRLIDFDSKDIMWPKDTGLVCDVTQGRTLHEGDDSLGLRRYNNLGRVLESGSKTLLLKL